MDQLWHLSALLNYLIEVTCWLLDKLLDSLLISEHTVLVIDCKFIHTQVRLSRHQQAVLNNVHQAETKEVQWDVHEIRRSIRHQSKNIFANDL